MIVAETIEGLPSRVLDTASSATELLAMTVDSPGYEVWAYDDDGTRARMPFSMELNCGELKKLQIALRKRVDK